MSSDLPITKNPAAQYVPWTVGLMMYLASLSVFLFILGFHFFGSWRHDLSTHITIEIPTQNLFSQTLSSQELKALTDKIIGILKNTPEVKNITLLSQEENQALLSPWLGAQNTLKLLPLPILIEVEKTHKEALELSVLESSLKKIFPPLRVINYHTHFSKVFLLGLSLEIFLLALMSAFFITAFLTLSFAARTSLLIHRNIIDILSLLGANDKVIAKEFQNHARTMAIRGASTAYALLLMTLALGMFLFKEDTGFSFPSLLLNHFSWGIFLGFLIPVIMGIFMVFSARLSIQKLLKKLDLV